MAQGSQSSLTDPVGAHTAVPERKEMGAEGRADPSGGSGTPAHEDGARAQEVAAELELSTETVMTHLETLFAKLLKRDGESR